MRWRESLLLVVSIASVPTVLGVSAFAQSDNPSRDLALSTALVMHAGSVMRPYVPASLDEHADLTLPSNVSVPGHLRSTIDAMLRRSPTFRRQCVRLAHASGLLVRLEGLSPHAPGGRARATIVSSGGATVATVQIKPLESLPELIAHEIEHVIEQLDGVDLPARAERPNSGVRRCGDGTFETTRAIHVGRIVAQELRSE